MKKLHKSILISIEGIDGSGKSTLANKLRDTLEHENLPVTLTYEPGDTPLGKQLRKILHERDYDICGESEFLLFASDRAQHIKEVIIPNMQEKKIIISDRMGDSSVVYQGYARGIDVNMIQSINKWAMKGIEPDLTFYIKVSTELALSRLKKRKGRPTSFEKEKETFTKKLIIGFEEIYKDKPNVIQLDGEQSADMLAKIAYANVKLFIQHNELLNE